MCKLPFFLRAHRVVALLSVMTALLVLCPTADSLPLSQHSHRHLLVGYFPQWGLRNAQPFYVKTLIANGSAARLDQINYYEGSVKGGHCSLAYPEAYHDTY